MDRDLSITGLALINSQLKKELYTENYYSIDWPAQRNNIAEVDNYAPHTRVLNGIYVILGAYESCVLPPARQIALQEVYKLIVQEDTNTTYQTLGPVGKMFNLVCRFHAEGTESKAYRLHELKRKEFMWVGREGMMMCGTNGSQLWDIGFTTQAVVESGLAEEKKNKDAMVKVLKWLDMCQIRDNPPYYESAYRHTTKGAWPFSTKEQGYTVSDCTGEGLKSVLYLQNRLKYAINSTRIAEGG
jgi:lanosterol synthase